MDIILLEWRVGAAQLLAVWVEIMAARARMTPDEQQLLNVTLRWTLKLRLRSCFFVFLLFFSFLLFFRKRPWPSSSLLTPRFLRDALEIGRAVKSLCASCLLRPFDYGNCRSFDDAPPPLNESGISVTSAGQIPPKEQDDKFRQS